MPTSFPARPCAVDPTPFHENTDAFCTHLSVFFQDFRPSMPVCLLAVLAIGGMTTIAQAQTDPWARWAQAEQADVAALTQGRDVRGLEAYRALQANDRRVLSAQLQPALRAGVNGWVDCPAARRALARALDTVGTVGTLQETLLTGTRIEHLHCAHRPDGANGWWGQVDGALLNVRGRLPGSFRRTQAAVAATSASQLRRSVSAQTFGRTNTACMAQVLATARKAGENFQPAQRRAVEKCRR